MIKPDLTHCNNLHELYNEAHRIYKEQEQFNYADHHNALHKYALQCSTIKELGVMQGISTAAMLFAQPQELIAIDIDDRRYKPYHKHFVTYAIENNIDYKYILGSSHDPKLVSEVEMIHIDTVHKPEFLRKEMHLHLPKVTKFAVFHDTTNYRHSRGLFKEIATYITEVDQNWKVVEHYTDWVGYTVLQRHYRKT